MQFCPITRELCRSARYFPPIKSGPIATEPAGRTRAELGGEYACAFSGAVIKTKTMMTCPKKKKEAA